MSQRKPLLLTTLLISAIALSACGGGSGGDKKKRDGGDGEQAPITGGNTGGGSKGPGEGSGGGNNGGEDNEFFGPSGQFKNKDQEPNNVEDDTFTELDELTNLKGQVNSQTDIYDAYGFTASQSGTYQLTLTNFGGNDLNLFLIDESGANPNFIGSNAPGQDETTEYTFQADGFYLLLVQGADTAGQTSDYQLVVEKRGGAGGGSGNDTGGNPGGGSGGGTGGNTGSGESEPNDQASQSNTITTNTDVNGTVNANEDAVDYYQIELPAGDNLIVLYGLDGASVNFDITAGPGGAVIASGNPMTDPDGFRRTLALDEPSQWGIRVVATDTNGRDQPYTLSVITD